MTTITKTIYIPLVTYFIEEFRNILPQSKKVLLFDIDNTLYSEETGLQKKIVEQIHAYAKKCGIPEERIAETCKGYTQENGLAIKGFVKDFGNIDVNDFYKNVDGSVNIKDYLSIDEELIDLLKVCKYKIYCFTNANRQHAEKVLDVLGITDYITGVFYCKYNSSGDFICKPDIEAYDFVESLLNDSMIYFWDDNLKNVNKAIEKGWKAEIITINDNIKSRLRNFYKNEELEEQGDIMMGEKCKTNPENIALEENEGAKENQF